MKWMVIAVAAIVMLVGAGRPHAQAKANFSGAWRYDQAKSGRGTGGNAPEVSFPSDLVIKHSATQVDFEASSSRQDVVKIVYKLDGAEMTLPGPADITIKTKSKMDGDMLVIESTRTFTSPAGPVTNQIKEVYTLSGGGLAVEKTVTTGGVASTAKAVYSKVP